MKKIVNKIKSKLVFTVLAGSLLLGSCESYLDQAPEASINPNDAYASFKDFQGFVEDLYNGIVNIAITTSPSGDFNLADETRLNVTFFLGQFFDVGDYWAAFTAYGALWRPSPLGNVTSLDPNAAIRHNLWFNPWYNIQKSNLGLANFERLLNATQEEKDMIKGQLLFFRGFSYFSLMRDFGGLPYIDKVLGPTDEMRFPRLNYRQTALKAAADLEEAAKLLPLDWDATQAGQRTLGNNRQRINKITALSFQAKTLLYAASPLMNKESTGKTGYDTELCKKAAEIFAQVVNTCDQTGRYSLQPWNSYTEMFFTVGADRKVPGGVETILNPPVFSYTESPINRMWGLPAIGHVAQQIGVCANYIKNWGMSNGLPIDDPASGFNPADPWVNRDPRFYKTIVVDGDKICISTSAGLDQYAQLFNGGRHRNSAQNITGFLTNKYWNQVCNRFDNGWVNYYHQLLPPIIRLSDVYLMYAEAVLQGYGTPKSNVAGCITAEAAVNKVRTRAGVPDIASKFTISKDTFMEQIVVERAVELAFEGHRWWDLRRWLKNGDPRYLDKTELLFDRDPVSKKPINIQERLMVQRVVSEKHNWLPLPVNQVSIYPEFGQNPGW